MERTCSFWNLITSRITKIRAKLIKGTTITIIVKIIASRITKIRTGLTKGTIIIVIIKIIASRIAKIRAGLIKGTIIIVSVATIVIKSKLTWVESCWKTKRRGSKRRG